MDCLIAICIALLGLLLIWYVFVSISSNNSSNDANKLLASVTASAARRSGKKQKDKKSGSHAAAADADADANVRSGRGARRLRDGNAADASATVAAAQQQQQQRSNNNNSKVNDNDEDDDDDDAVLDALVAREVVRNPTGMSVDSKTLQPSALEVTTHTRQGKGDGRRQAAVAEIDERTVRIDRELGFQTVGVQLSSASKKQKQQQKQQQHKQRGADAVAPDEDMERKLSNFFRNSARKPGRGAGASTGVGKLSFDEERVNVGTGGRVVIKRDIGNARSW